MGNKTHQIKSLNKTQYIKIKTIKDFKQAENDLIHQKKYFSVSAEKHRLYYKNKIFKVGSSKGEEAFKSLIMSYLYNIDSKIKYEELERVTYLTNIKSKEICKIDKYVENKEFSFIFIVNDVVYYNEFYLRVKPKKSFSVITISNKILAPFTLDFLSLKSTLAKLDFNKKFKLYYEEIEKGLSKWLLS